MAHNQEKEKKSRTFKWYLDKILMVLVAIFLLVGIVICVGSAEDGNTKLMLIGGAMIPGTGLLATPNIVLSAIKDSKVWKSRSFKAGYRKSFERQLHSEDAFNEINDFSPYHSKIVAGVIRNAILNFGGLILLIVIAIIGNIYSFFYDVDSDRAQSFFILLCIAFCLIPIFSYGITCSICRIRTVLRHEYSIYYAVASFIDGSDLYITGAKGNEYKLKYCTCLGIRKKEIHDTKVILAIVPDEVYLLPYNTMSY